MKNTIKYYNDTQWIQMVLDIIHIIRQNFFALTFMVNGHFPWRLAAMHLGGWRFRVGGWGWQSVFAVFFFFSLFAFFHRPLALPPTQTVCLLSCNGLRACLAALGIKLKPLLPNRKTVHYGRARLLCKLSHSLLCLLIIKDYQRRVQGLHHRDDVTSLKWAGTAFRHICCWRKNIDW